MADFIVIPETISRVRGAYSAAAFRLVQDGVSPSSQQGIDFQTLGRVIDDWATRRASWASNGQRDDGSLYGLDRWITEGQGYAADASYRAGLAFDSNPFVLAVKTALAAPGNVPKDLSDGLNKLTSPTQWPWYAQVAVGSVAIFYASQIFANFRGRK